MAEGSILTSDLPSYVLYGLFESFGEETISDDDIRNYNDVSELSNGSICYLYLDASGDDSDSVNLEEELCTMSSM